MSDPTKVTPASVIRRHSAEARVLELPVSGYRVRVRQISAADLVMAGAIPDTLWPHIYRELDDLQAGRSVAERNALFEERIETINTVCAAMLAEPRMVKALAPHEALGEDTILPADLPFNDRVYLFQLALGQGDLEALARFPGEPDRGVPAAPAGEGLLDSPV